MRLLLMGDFSHRPASERRPMAERPTLRVDVDNLDACIARLVARVQLEAGKIVIEQIEDLGDRDRDRARNPCVVERTMKLIPIRKARLAVRSRLQTVRETSLRHDTCTHQDLRYSSMPFGSVGARTE
jgi:hypothetical protein